MFKREETIGFRVRTLSVAFKRAADAGKEDMENGKITRTHGWVIGYLYENRHRDVYQRDIEKQFSVRRPTMTEILKLMEKNGLIQREKDIRDARLKKILLTPLALEIHERHERNIQAFEEYIREGISDEELETFFKITEKLRENIEKAEREQVFGNISEKENQ